MKKTINLFVTALLLMTLAASMFGSQTVLASAQAASQVRWEAIVKLSPEASRLVMQDRSALTDPLLKLGVSARVNGDWLSLNGQKDMAQASAALFDTSASWLDFLGGPVELTIYPPSNGKPLTLNLEARNTTGYIWEVMPGDGGYVQSGEAEFAMRYHGVGVPAIQTIRLAATRSGDTSIRLLYHRPFEAAAEPHARLNVWLTEAADALELSDPTPAVIAEVETPRQEDPDAYAELDELKTALPASWDWRTQGIVPDVRDQASCGSCWAFGTVGVMESAVAKGGGPMTDLSEQFLISCNKDGWSCSGGLTATKYHYNVLGLNQTAAGAVLESAKPYTATNGTCTVAYSHPYKASGWAFIVPSEFTMPTVDQIKNAMYTYGPITAGVCVDNGWYSYTGGVYNPPANVCSGSTNHQIVLVGWDDATSSWILRNSWGPGWGEAGYMRIRWDTTGTKSRVGEGTSWVTYSSTPSTVPVLVSPSGTITDTTPTFTWKKVTDATQYRFQVYQGTTLKYTKTVSSSACGTTNCTDTPTTVLSLAAHKWRAQAYVGGVWKTYSAYKNFTVAAPTAGFDSQFNGTSTGWSAVKGAWSIYSSMYYRSTGLANLGASAKHTGSYGNFTYQVRMKRTGTCTGCANRVIIRGNPASLSSTFWWQPSYVFQYSNDGMFSVYEMSSTGTSVALKSWTTSSAIVKNGWNTLKVVASGTSLKFYINGTLVWSGTDSTLTTGTVGLGFYRDSYTGTLDVDWAKLTVPVTATLDFDPSEMVITGEEMPGGSIDMSPR
jgi:C1A family cysteine protease